MAINTIAEQITSDGTIPELTPSRINTADVGIAMQFVASVYSRPRDAVVRELSANGIDAHRAAGINKPVEVTLPTVDKPTLTIKDFGIGMDALGLSRSFGDYHSSTKREIVDQIGYMGVGCKTPYAVADQFTVVSVHNGISRSVLFAKLPNGAGTGHAILIERETDEPNSTTISVPVDIKDIHSWDNAAHRVFYWWEPETVLVDGRTPETFHDRIEPEFSTDEKFFLKDVLYRGERIVRINGLAYEVPSVMGDACELWGGVINAPVDAPLTISKSRETIDDTDEGRAWLKQAEQQWLDVMAQRTTTLLSTLKTTQDACEFDMQVPWYGPRAHAYKHKNHREFNMYTFMQENDLPYEITADMVAYDPSWEKAQKYHPTINGHSLTRYDMIRMIEPHEFTPKVQRLASRWVKTRPDRPSAALIVVSPNTEGFEKFFSANKIRWITGAELIQQTPVPAPDTEPVSFQQITDIVNYFNTSYNTTDISLKKLRERAEAGCQIIVTTKKELNDNSVIRHLAPVDETVVILRGNRSIKNIAALLHTSVFTVDAAAHRHITEKLTAMTDQERTDLAEVLPLRLSRRQRSFHHEVAHWPNLTPEAKHLVKTLGTAPGGPVIWAYTDWVQQHYLMPKPVIPDLYPRTMRFLKDYSSLIPIHEIDVEILNAVVAADLAHAQAKTQP